MTPPAATAFTTAAEVQLSGVPSPTVRVGLLVSAALAAAGTEARPFGLPGFGSFEAEADAVADADAEVDADADAEDDGGIEADAEGAAEGDAEGAAIEGTGRPVTRPTEPPL
ncbi:hypothetical protein AB0F72_38690 [Actinoplanes sp. NPDC023936]|uniref:hypothetical protein n=1 Tax=Actinoplanes sp. NPDC023936 TaxID=3154910 RepID=UPI0033E7962C